MNPSITDLPSQNPLLINALTTPVVPTAGSSIGNRFNPLTAQSIPLPLTPSPSAQTVSGRSSCDTEHSFSSQALTDPLVQAGLNSLSTQCPQSDSNLDADENISRTEKTELERQGSPTSFSDEPQPLFQFLTTNNPGMPLRPSASLLKSDVQKLTAAVNAIIPHLPAFPLRLNSSRSNSEKELQVSSFW